MRLIDADALLKKLNEEKILFNAAINDLIVNAPTVDAEPVVRCDDCIYRDGKTAGQPNILCWQMHVDDFCSYGTRVDESKEQSKGETKERKEDAETN